MTGRRARVWALTLLALLGPGAARAETTADLVLSLGSARTNGVVPMRPEGARLLVDTELGRELRLHLDLDRQATATGQWYEGYSEWGAGAQRLRLGRFQVPFGISNRSELYYVGLINGPVIKYSQAEGGQLDDSQVGVGYLRSLGGGQVEAALFSSNGREGPTGTKGEGAIRLQRSLGPVILGLNGLWGRTQDIQSGKFGQVWIAGLDGRYSRPALIVRGELVAGRVPDGPFQGFYLDLLYHPLSLHRFTLVGRTEAARGLSGYGHSYARQTLGLKCDLGHGTAVAVNQAFDAPHVRSGGAGATIFVWHTRRL